MNAVAEARPAVSVALLGPADAAREQLRQALVMLGAELVFEGELSEGGRLSEQPPQVLIVNLEPGVEDELDALQGLLDSPRTSVVFNEGEVSSQLTGWDLARWARHLAVKVLGVRDTLPPPPNGAERLPELSLLPEPGRPATPSQQQDHLQFDTFAEEAVGLRDGVPSSPRLEEISSEPTPELDGLDFDFNPVVHGETTAAPESRAEQTSNDELEGMDLSSIFEQDLGQVSPDDMLLKLQQAMGLESRLTTAQADATRTRSDVGVPEPAEFQSSLEVPDAAPPIDPQGAEPSVEIDPGQQQAEPAAVLDFDWDAALSGSVESHADADTSPSIAQGDRDPEADLALQPEAGVDRRRGPGDAETALEDQGVADSSSGDYGLDGDVMDTEAAVLSDASFNFDPVAFDAELDADAHPRSQAEPGLPSGHEALAELDLTLHEQSAGGVDEFDFRSFDTAEETASGAVSMPRFDSEDASLGGTLTLDSAVDDEEIARLAAELDAQPGLPSAADLPPLEFDFSKPEPPPELQSEASAPTQSEPAAESARSAKPAASGFGALSLQPMEDGFIDTTAKAPPAPAASFDFSALNLSLEPIEDSPAGVGSDAEDVQVSTMRDGAWLRDIGESVPEQADPGAAPASGVETGGLGRPAAPDALDEAARASPADAAANFGEASQIGIASPVQRTPEPLAGPVSRVLVLCASIGGPDALRGFLAAIPAGFPALFIVVQHLENGYFERLAQQLQKASKLPVRVPISGIAARDGEVLVVSSGTRFVLSQNGDVELVAHEQASRYRPCIDDVLKDIAEAFGAHAHAIIFSGMAADAVEGAVHLSQRGGEVWAQDPESCVVSSMVDGARARGVVEFVGSPRELADRCVRRYGGQS